MRRYKWRIFLVTFTLSLVACVLVLDVADIWNSSNYSMPNGYMNMPGDYYEIASDISVTGAELSENDILDRLSQVLSEDEDAIAIFLCNNLYIYDPSGYYNTTNMKGGYFSKEDFKCGGEKGVLICNKSAYSFMQNEGRTYCFGKYRNVIGQYTQEHPLYKYSGVDIVQCLCPDAVINVNFSGKRCMESRLYIANCDEIMAARAKQALGEAGWTVIESNDVKAFVLERPALGHVLRFQAFDQAMTVWLIFVMGVVVLCVYIYKDFSGMNSICYGFVPSLFGYIAGNVAVSVYRWLSSGHILLTEVSMSAVVSIGFVAFLMIIVWIYSTIRKIAAMKIIMKIPQRAFRCVKRAGATIISVVLICLIIFFGYADIAEAKQTIQNMWKRATIGSVQTVEFISSWSGRADINSGEICKIAIKAMDEGKAFSVVENKKAYVLVVGSKALKDTYKLKWVKNVPAAYPTRDNKKLKKGDIIKVTVGNKTIDVPVAENMKNDTIVDIGHLYRWSINSRPIVILDSKDCVESGRISKEVLENMLFVNASATELIEYVKCMDKAGVDYYIHGFEMNSGNNEAAEMAEEVFSLAYIGVLAIMLIMFISTVIKIKADDKGTEVRVSMLYGAGFKDIWLRMLPLAAEIILPAVIISRIILPIRQLISYMPALSVSGNYAPYSFALDSINYMTVNRMAQLAAMLNFALKMFFKSPGTIIWYVAVGAALSALVAAFTARRIMRRYSMPNLLKK